MIEQNQMPIEGEDDNETPAINQDEQDFVRKVQRQFKMSKDHTAEWREEARRAYDYRACRQWTEDEIATLKRRGQQPTVRNRTKRKIDFLVGTEQRLRRDPKAYPRTPKHERDTDSATAGMRYVCDVNRWDKVSSDCMHDGLVSGIGIAFVGIEGEDPKIRYVNVDRFFYDPRSVEPDFSDARYLGLHL
mgnify:CR=1 FL=1